MQRLMIIDDDSETCILLTKFLTKNGYQVDSAHSGYEAMKLLRVNNYTLILCDYRLPDTNGVEMLERIKVLKPDVAIIIITGYSDVRTAVQTFKNGASDYLVKPLMTDEILVAIQEVTKRTGAKTRSPSRTSALDKKFIMGKSLESENVLRHVNLVAPSDMSVIIFGETGTGKEYIARAIRQKSKRNDNPFVAVDCGAMTKELAGSELFGHVKGAFTGAVADKTGSFELANTGTLFLDEVGNLSYENQIKLLRVLQERTVRKIGDTRDIQVDVRIITATNEDLSVAVKDGRFREDLYHRLNEFKIEIAPLRDRKIDIEIFARHFLAEANQSLNKNIEGFSKDAMDALLNYAWYGNLRELNNVVKRATLLTSGNWITTENIPQEILASAFINEKNGNGSTHHEKNMLKSISGQAERRAIIDILEKTGFNKTKAAEALKIDRKTLYNKLKAYDIKTAGTFYS